MYRQAVNRAREGVSSAGRTILRVDIESTLKTPHTVPLTVRLTAKRSWKPIVHLEPGTTANPRRSKFLYIPDTLGLHRAVATVGTVPDESNLLNNTATAFFRVFRTKIGVWYVEGALRPEFGKIRMALETAPNVNFKAINAFSANTGSAADLLPTKPRRLGAVAAGDHRRSARGAVRRRSVE